MLCRILPILAACLLATSGASQELDVFAAPEQPETLEELSLWATEYYVHIADAGGTIPFLSPAGDTLAFCADSCDFCTACLEGTVFLLDSTGSHSVLNYAARDANAQMNCRLCSQYTGSSLRVESWGSVRWKHSSGYGEGVRGYHLVPYRTVAVDPKLIPYGSVLYVPAARGTAIAINDSTTIEHDGYFFAGDTGGAIKGNHIDVFTGTDASHPFDFVRSSAKHTYEVRLVEDPDVLRVLTEIHANGN